MQINLQDDISLKDAISETRYQWLMHHKRRDESDNATAYRLGVSSRTIFRWRRKLKNSIKESPLKQQAEVCVFCNTKFGLRKHHIHGIKNSTKAILLCKKCHVKFHSLNKKIILQI